MQDFIVKFNWHGFDPSAKIKMEEKELKEMIDSLVTMYNRFCEYSNEALDQINHAWEQYERVKKLGDYGVGAMAIDEACKVMGIDRETTYVEWVEKWYKEIAESVDEDFKDSKFRGKIFVYGEIVQYGIVRKDNPALGLDFSLEAA